MLLTQYQPDQSVTISPVCICKHRTFQLVNYFGSLRLTTFPRAEINLPDKRWLKEVRGPSQVGGPGGGEALPLEIFPALVCNRNRSSPFQNPSAVMDSGQNHWREVVGNKTFTGC